MSDTSAIDAGTERLIARREPPIGWLVFNNPERRNAMSVDMWRGVAPVLAAFEADPDIRVVVLTGAGEAAFVSGADISPVETERASPAAQTNYGDVTGEAHAALARLAKPSIAMIRGFCIGGGLALALSCDLRVAAEDAQFGIPAARLGLGYGYAGLAALTAVVGPAYAKEIMFTARRFDAKEALRMGLVNQVVPADQLEAVVRERAGQIAANAPLTVKAAKMAVDEALKDPAQRDLKAVNAAVAACFASEDFIEGRRAFLEKRPPRFRGR